MNPCLYLSLSLPLVFHADIILSAEQWVAYLKHACSCSKMLFGKCAGTLALATITGWSFYKVKPVAGWLFVPYVAFLIFANKLNAAIIALNPNVGGPEQPVVDEGGKVLDCQISISAKPLEKPVFELSLVKPSLLPLGMPCG
jgi:hypothetical protein